MTVDVTVGARAWARCRSRAGGGGVLAAGETSRLTWSLLGMMITLGSVLALTADIRRMKSTFVSGETIGTMRA